MAFSLLGETNPSRSFPRSWCKLSVDLSSSPLEFVSIGLNERGVSSSFCYEEKKMYIRLRLWREIGWGKKAPMAMVKFCFFDTTWALL